MEIVKDIKKLILFLAMVVLIGCSSLPPTYNPSWEPRIGDSEEELLAKWGNSYAKETSTVEQHTVITRNYFRNSWGDIRGNLVPRGTLFAKDRIQIITQDGKITQIIVRDN